MKSEGRATARSGKPPAERSPSTKALAVAAAAGRRQHIGRLLLTGFRVFERLALVKFAELGFSDLRLSHLAILRNLSPEGVRTSEIADLADMTKQAVGQLATELEEFGYVERMSDPTDGRAKLLQLTTRGQKLYADIPKVLVAVEAEFEAMIGKAQLSGLRRSLRKLALASGAERIG